MAGWRAVGFAVLLACIPCEVVCEDVQSTSVRELLFGEVYGNPLWWGDPRADEMQYYMGDIDGAEIDAVATDVLLALIAHEPAAYGRYVRLQAVSPPREVRSGDFSDGDRVGRASVSFLRPACLSWQDVRAVCSITLRSGDRYALDEHGGTVVVYARSHELDTVQQIFTEVSGSRPEYAACVSPGGSRSVEPVRWSEGMGVSGGLHPVTTVMRDYTESVGGLLLFDTDVGNELGAVAVGDGLHTIAAFQYQFWSAGLSLSHYVTSNGGSVGVLQRVSRRVRYPATLVWGQVGRSVQSGEQILRAMHYYEERTALLPIALTRCRAVLDATGVEGVALSNGILLLRGGDLQVAIVSALIERICTGVSFGVNAESWMFDVALNWV